MTIDVIAHSISQMNFIATISKPNCSILSFVLSFSAFKMFLYVFKSNIEINLYVNRSIFNLQFPIKLSHHRHHHHHQHDKTAADHLGLNYVTERILASVLPKQQHQQSKQNEYHNDGPHIAEPVLDESPQDIYEQELISMLEQKHGKVNIKRNSNMQINLCEHNLFFLFCSLPLKVTIWYNMRYNQIAILFRFQT